MAVSMRAWQSATARKRPPPPHVAAVLGVLQARFLPLLCVPSSTSAFPHCPPISETFCITNAFASLTNGPSRSRHLPVAARTSLGSPPSFLVSPVPLKPPRLVSPVPLKPPRFVSPVLLKPPRLVGPLQLNAMTTASDVAPSGTCTATAAPKTEHVVLKPVHVPKEKHRKDYTPPDFVVDNVDLSFNLDETSTEVVSKVKLWRRKGAAGASDLMLDGEQLDLKWVKVNDKDVKSGSGGYLVGADGSLAISAALLPAEPEEVFLVETKVVIKPLGNTQFMGLYKSGKLFCSQCEAEGFRRITYFLDRPDVMAKYQVRIEADKKSCPVLLSKGNRMKFGDVEGSASRHFAVFSDPFPKPCYLFALVAGDLKPHFSTFTTMSNKKVELAIYSEPEDADKLAWAMEGIKKAMKWDEEEYGLEYDLSVFNVVCVRDFNMGAMENKGLNVFNTALLLADEKTSTDGEFQRIWNVVGHEYFHNWTGNRVTLMDWFQLTLKEGLTVFRDQQFTSHCFSAAVKRIEDVIYVRSHQFNEDSGPLAHPIRPESYIAMDNFYTSTVYDKGAEVIRMYYTLLGKEGFRKGMDLYFKLHDGKAVTCDDFRAAMANANKYDLSQFDRWYSQAGTPVVEVVESMYDKEKKLYRITLKQHTPATPNQPIKLPFLIPVKFGLLGRQSKRDLLSPEGKLLELREEEQTFEFENIEEDPVPSVLRNFSAPVKLVFERSDEDKAFLMAYDSDDVNRWHAAQSLAMKIILDFANQLSGSCPKDVNCLGGLPTIFMDSFKSCLTLNCKDMALQAYTLRLPDEATMSHEMNPVDPKALHLARNALRRKICEAMEPELRALYDSLTTAENPELLRSQSEVGRRKLRNVMLYFLTGREDEAAGEIAYSHFTNSSTMTDKMAALATLCDFECKTKELAFKRFYDDAQGDALVVDKWFSMQASSGMDSTVELVEQLRQHPDFNAKNPNRLRSLIFSFARNAVAFHRIDGKGYKLLAEVVADVDKFNNQIAARACSFLILWKRFDQQRQELMKKELAGILEIPGLSKDTMEIVTKGLKE